MTKTKTRKSPLFWPPWLAEERILDHHLVRPEQALFGERSAPFHSAADKKARKQRRTDPHRIRPDFTG
jgi:hypothetical protein